MYAVCFKWKRCFRGQIADLNSFNFRLLKCIYCWVKYVFNGDSFLPIVMETAWRSKMKRQVQTMFWKWSSSRLKAAIYFHTVSDIAPKIRRNKCEKARENKKRSSLRNDKKWCQNTTRMYIHCWHVLAETRRCILIKWIFLLLLLLFIYYLFYFIIIFFIINSSAIYHKFHKLLSILNGSLSKVLQCFCLNQSIN